MKKLLFLLAVSLTVGTALAQVPQKLSYEAIVRDSAFVALDSVQVGIQLSLVSDTTSGTPVYFETHTATTGSSGLVQLQIGTGTTIDTFSAINWADGPYYLMTKIDPAGGTNYSISGVTKMLAVPYAHVSVSATKADTAGRAAGLNFRVSYQGDSLVLGNGEFLILPGLSLAYYYSSGYVHCDTANPTIIQTVTSTTGRVWMDRNLGASRVAQSSDDSLAYGDLYQWGRFADGHQCRDSETTGTKATTSASLTENEWHGKYISFSPDGTNDWLVSQDSMLWQGVNGGNNPCPTNFRLPTNGEWQDEIDEWGSEKNASGALNSPLKLPIPGDRSFVDGKIYDTGTFGYYWSSSVKGTKSLSWFIDDSLTDLDQIKARAAGNSVRCIKDQP